MFINSSDGFSHKEDIAMNDYIPALVNVNRDLRDFIFKSPIYVTENSKYQCK